MPRYPKLFFASRTQSEYFSIHGKRHPLGKDSNEACREFNKMQARPAQVATENSTLHEFSFCDTLIECKRPFERHLRSNSATSENASSRPLRGVSVQ